jgi:hypothetical protein
MGKSHRRRSSVVKSISKTASKTLPVVDKGLKTVGSTAKNVVDASIPVVEKGVSAVYGTMATGLDLGVKGAKSITKSIKSKRSSHRRHSRSLAGGRRTRRRHRRR